MSFKAETDDIRDSLSIVLVNILKKKKLNVLTSDEYYKHKKNVKEFVSAINDKQIVTKKGTIGLSIFNNK